MKRQFTDMEKIFENYIFDKQMYLEYTKNSQIQQ